MHRHYVEASSPTSGTLRGAPSVWLASVLWVAVIAAVDYFSGSELRVFPLYYAPISLAAWSIGRSAALTVAALCAVAWVGSNFLAGLRFSNPVIWVVNTLMQGASFAITGLLIATLRASLVREKGLSRTDPLTSLLNGRAFYEEGDRLLALCRRKGRPISMAYIDLDNFKTVNDRQGHQAGDDLLCRVAALLRASVRPSDVSARLGGDEFAVLLPEVGADDAAVILERLRSVLAGALGSDQTTVSASIGGVAFVTAPGSVEEMVHRADARMYMAKAAGKNRVQLEVVDNSETPVEEGHADAGMVQKTSWAG